MEALDVGVALAVVLAVVLVAVAISRPAARAPRLQPRPLPRIRSGVDTEPSTGTRITIAGRTYEVVEPEARVGFGGQCSWCLGPLEAEEADDLVRCPHPQCRRVGHRRHVEEFGGCGGVCGLLS